MTETQTKEKEEQEPITMQSIEGKMDKGEELSREEENFLLQQDKDAPEGYANIDVEDMSTEEFDEDDEKEEAEKKEKEDKQKDEEEEEPKDEKKETKDDDTDPMVKILADLDKDEDKVDLSDYTERERAYYHQMRRDKKKRQEAEKGLAEANLRLKESEEAKKKAEESIPDPLDELRNKNPEDYITVEEALKIAEKKKKAENDAGDATKNDEIKDVEKKYDPVTVQYLKMAEKAARVECGDDFDEVIELTDEIIGNNPKHLVTLKKALDGGENPAVVTYNIIKSDPDFANLLPAAKLRVQARRHNTKSDSATSSDKDEKKDEQNEDKEPDKEPEDSPEEKAKKEKAQKNQDALKKKKPKTTAHVETNSGGDEFGGYTAEEIAGMSQLEFNQIPKKERDRYLKMYG